MDLIFRGLAEFTSIRTDNLLHRLFVAQFKLHDATLYERLIVGLRSTESGNREENKANILFKPHVICTVWFE